MDATTYFGIMYLVIKTLHLSQVDVKIANVKYHVIDSYYNMGTHLYKKRKCVQLTITKQLNFFPSMMFDN